MLPPGSSDDGLAESMQWEAEQYIRSCRRREPGYQVLGKNAGTKPRHPACSREEGQGCGLLTSSRWRENSVLIDVDALPTKRLRINYGPSNSTPSAAGYRRKHMTINIISGTDFVTATWASEIPVSEFMQKNSVSFQ
jgi:hypothetical protein